MNRLIILTILLSTFFLSSCSNNPNSDTSDRVQSVVLPDDFIEFLEAFHADLDFQKSHIQWPLQGIPSMMDSRDTTLETSTFRWQQDNWVMHHDFLEDNDEFEQTYSVFSEDMIIEQILHINGSIGMERRFAKRDDSWNLIYYAGMNVIKQ